MLREHSGFGWEGNMGMPNSALVVTDLSWKFHPAVTRVPGRF